MLTGKQSIAARVERIWHKYVATPREKDRLEKVADPRIQAISSAIRATTNRGALTAAESSAIARIEAERLAMAQEPTLLKGVGNDELPVSQVVKASKPPKWCLHLYHLIRQLKPTVCLELGTCVGISAAYTATALSANQNGGRLTTMEGGSGRAERSRETLRKLGCDNAEVVAGLFIDTLPGVLSRIGTIDFAFIDGHHDPDATLSYFEMIFPHLASHAVLAFDDIYWRDMAQAWEKRKVDPRFCCTIDHNQIGVCVVNNSGLAPEIFRITI